VLLGLQWLSVAAAPLSRLLTTVPLAGGDWLVLAAGVLWPVVALEIVKASRGRLLGQPRPTSTDSAAAP